MTYKVNLKLFQDDATGEYGLAHENAVDIETPFNAFWTQQGIFHDVFEHYFEGVHPDFRGNYAFNIGGEIAAMGHLAYYWSNFHLYERWFKQSALYSYENIIINGTQSEIEESVSYGYCRFGNELLCNLPYQKPSDDYIEEMIYDHWCDIRKLTVKTDNEYEKEYALQYKNSLKKSKIQRLYRWGYKQAERKFPKNNHNSNKLRDFLELWKDICTGNDAEELYNWGISKFEFTIKTGENMDWKCIAVTSSNQRIAVKNKYITDLLLDLNY